MVIRSGLLGALGLAAALSLTAPAFAEGPDHDTRPEFRLAGQSYHQGTTGYPNQDDLAKAATAALELGYLIYKESKYKDHDDDHYREVDYGHGKKHRHGYWHKHGYGSKHWHDHGHKHGHYKKKHKKKRYKHSHGHYKHHHKRDYGNYRDSDHYPWRYDKRGYKRHVKVHRYHGGGYDCHPVKKKGYFHGRPAKIGGTMCYDRYGNGYIAKGSRYVIKYLGY